MGHIGREKKQRIIVLREKRREETKRGRCPGPVSHRRSGKSRTYRMKERERVKQFKLN